MTVDQSSERYRLTMGFNPFRESETSAIDIIMVVLAIGAAIGLVAWAIFSG
ncbi:MAG TPA: hypothetical protein VIW94_08825 [Acidimicrobiia bacterium]